MIAEVTELMGKTAPAEHYARSQQRLTVESGGSGFDLLQFNMLAEGLSSGPDVTAPFPFDKASGFGGFDSVPNPEVCMAWKLRKWRLVEEMLR